MSFKWGVYGVTAVCSGMCVLYSRTFCTQMDSAATDLGESAHTTASVTLKSQTVPQGGAVVVSPPALPPPPHPHPPSDSSGQQHVVTETTSDSPSSPLLPPPPPPPPHPPPFTHPPPPTANGVSSDVSVTSPSQSAISGDMEAEEEEQEEEEGEGDDSQDRWVPHRCSLTV